MIDPTITGFGVAIWSGLSALKSFVPAYLGRWPGIVRAVGAQECHADRIFLGSKVFRPVQMTCPLVKLQGWATIFGMNVMTCVGVDFALSGLKTLRISDPGLPPWAISFGPFGAAEAVAGP